MSILVWLARYAARLRWPRANGHTDHDHQRDRRFAARSLHARLPGHLRRDIGADDG